MARDGEGGVGRGETVELGLSQTGNVAHSLFSTMQCSAAHTFISYYLSKISLTKALLLSVMIVINLSSDDWEAVTSTIMCFWFKCFIHWTKKNNSNYKSVDIIGLKMLMHLFVVCFYNAWPDKVRNANIYQNIKTRPKISLFCFDSFHQGWYFHFIYYFRCRYLMKYCSPSNIL